MSSKRLILGRDIRFRSCPNISGKYSTGHAKHPSCVNCMTAQCVYIRKEHYYAHSCSLLKDNIRKDSILHSIWTLKGNLKVLTMLYLGHTVHCLHNYYVHYVCSESTVVNACSTMLILKYSISYIPIKRLNLFIIDYVLKLPKLGKFTAFIIKFIIMIIS